MVMYANTNTVYVDKSGRPYTTNGINPYDRNFINIAPVQQPAQQQSPISALLAQSLAAKPNVPTMAQLFSGMPAPNMGGMFGNANGTGGLLGGYTGYGQYGAGRFLGSNVMGNPSLTSTAMNT